MDFSIFDIDFNLHDRVALVTGAAQGLGETVTTLFAKKGANVILVDMQEEKMRKVVDSLSSCGRKGFPVAVDLTNRNDIRKAVELGLKEFGRIDILVNNAGIALLDRAEDLSEEYWDKTMAVNLNATFFISQLVGKDMIKRKSGKIISVASQGGIIALDRHVAYCVSKAAIIEMTKVLALEWGKYNINVNAISPTAFLTEMTKQVWGGKEGDVLKKQIPLGRFGYPEEIAAAILFLASDASNMITGANLVIDGGYTIQ